MLLPLPLASPVISTGLLTVQMNVVPETPFGFEMVIAANCCEQMLRLAGEMEMVGVAFTVTVRF